MTKIQQQPLFCIAVTKVTTRSRVSPTCCNINCEEQSDWNPLTLQDAEHGDDKMLIIMVYLAACCIICEEAACACAWSWEQIATWMPLYYGAQSQHRLFRLIHRHLPKELCKQRYLSRHHQLNVWLYCWTHCLGDLRSTAQLSVTMLVSWELPVWSHKTRQAWHLQSPSSIFDLVKIRSCNFWFPCPTGTEEERKAVFSHNWSWESDKGWGHWYQRQKQGWAQD